MTSLKQRLARVIPYFRDNSRSATRGSSWRPALSVSSRTVKFHQGNILQKLGADSRADLLRLAGF